MFDDMRHEIKVWQRWRAIKAIRTEKTITQNNFNIIQDNDTYYPQTEIAVGMISAIDRDDRHHEMNMRHLDEMQSNAYRYESPTNSFSDSLNNHHIIGSTNYVGTVTEPSFNH